MDTQHSPTPWSLNYEFDIHDARGDVVAAVHGTEETESHANARLLLAAPDLLEALRLYVVLGSGKCTIGKPQVEMALAAIRKAEGA